MLGEKHVNIEDSISLAGSEVGGSAIGRADVLELNSCTFAPYICMHVKE